VNSKFLSSKICYIFSVFIILPYTIGYSSSKYILNDKISIFYKSLSHLYIIFTLTFYFEMVYQINIKL